VLEKLKNKWLIRDITNQPRTLKPLAALLSLATNSYQN
jgi:hypothetical protein